MVALYAWQGGRCALCGGDVPVEFTVADHCHRDGEVRGLLCTGCNALDGHGPGAADCLDRGAALRRYRAHPPMRMLGLRCQYSDCQGWRQWCAYYDAQQIDHWRVALAAQEHRGAEIR